MPGFSLRNPHAVIVGALIIIILGLTAFMRMPVDVFPRLHIPVVQVATFYSGMPPLEIEANITTRFERFFTLGSGIEHMESRSLPGVSIIKVFLQQGVDLDAAAAQIGNLAMANLRHLPPGTLPPLVLKSGASSLPVTLVTISGKGFTETQLRDQAQYNVRNWLATVPGTSVPPPFGGKYRQIMVYVNESSLHAHGLTLMNVVTALNRSNLIIPSGDAKIGNTDYFVYTNSMIEDPEDINKVPIKVAGLGVRPVFVGDVAETKDSSQIQQNTVLINGQRSVYCPVLKQSGANTLSIVDGIEQMLPNITDLPQGMSLKAIFSQSTYIRNAINALKEEAVLASILASLTVLFFLGSFRSTFAIFLSIPLSILAAAFGLMFAGGTVNVMTLGGFALAIGRLVDNSIVVLENINRHLARGEEPRAAALKGAEQVALPVLAFTITTCIVFFPVMFLFGVSKYLFGALALTVVLSLLASYVVSMTTIPIYCAFFLTKESAQAAEHGGKGFLGAFIHAYDRFALRYEKLLNQALDHKGAVIGAVAVFFFASLLIYPLIGTELFPTTDAGQFIINYRAPVGSRLEVTEGLTKRMEEVVRQVIPAQELSTIVSNIGLQPGFSAIFSSNAASDSGFMMVALKEGHKGSTFDYIDRLKRALAEKVHGVQTFFTSGSIIDSVMNFGLAAPIDVQVTGSHYSVLYPVARQVKKILHAVPQVENAFIPEESEHPTLNIKVDRVRAARLGLDQRDVVTNLITALTSNAMIAPSIWIDPKTGNDYFLTAQYSEQEINSLETLKNIPVSVKSSERSEGVAVPLRNVATIDTERHPAEAAHYNIRRVVDVLVSPRTRDLGGTQAAVEKALQAVKLPPGVKIMLQGSVATMRKSFSSFGFGLIMAVVLLYLVMVAQFRSFVDPFIIMFAVPMGLIGVLWTLYLTNTTLNIESFMGIIVMVGIVVANSILLVDFANERRRKGQPLRQAVVESARIRMRPVLMTALATIVGLLPLALALGEGSEASAPLARAAGGGLAVSTALTLILVPAVYELIYARRKVKQ